MKFLYGALVRNGIPRYTIMLDEIIVKWKLSMDPFGKGSKVGISLPEIALPFGN